MALLTGCKESEVFTEKNNSALTSSTLKSGSTEGDYLIYPIYSKIFKSHFQGVMIEGILEKTVWQDRTPLERCCEPSEAFLNGARCQILSFCEKVGL